MVFFVVCYLAGIVYSIIYFRKSFYFSVSVRLCVCVCVAACYRACNGPSRLNNMGWHSFFPFFLYLPLSLSLSLCVVNACTMVGHDHFFLFFVFFQLPGFSFLLFFHFNFHFVILSPIFSIPHICNSATIHPLSIHCSLI